MSNSSYSSKNSKQSNPDPSADENSGDSLSKTALKREAERLQSLGRKIAELPTEQRSTLALPDNLNTAIADYLRFPSHGAKRRQLQYIGKVMRGLDWRRIEQQIETLEGHSAEARYQFHQTEQWRDRLLSEPAALAEYIDQHPDVDRQALRHAVKKAQKARTDQQIKTESRALFRFLREQQDQA